MSKYDKWYIIRKLLCSTFGLYKKICKFAKLEFVIAKSSYTVKMFAKKMSKNDKLYCFKKPLTISNIQTLLQILNNLICNSKILKMCKFLLTGCTKVICKHFLAKLVQFVSLCHRLSKKLKIIKIKMGQNKDLVCYRIN